MTRRDTFSMPTGWRRMKTLRSVLRRGNVGPKIGITQGGSSRTHAGAKSAATDGLARPKKLGVDP